MFDTVKTKLRDMRTLSQLFTAAEAVARAHGKDAPASEHFVLAALELPDGSARQVFERLGASGDAFEEALRTQFADALQSVGLQLSPDAAQAAALSPDDRNPIYRAAPSGQALVQRLARSPERKRERPLVGADILLAASEEEFSTASRAFARLGITRAQLAEAAAAFTR